MRCGKCYWVLDNNSRRKCKITTTSTCTRVCVLSLCHWQGNELDRLPFLLLSIEIDTRVIWLLSQIFRRRSTSFSHWMVWDASCMEFAFACSQLVLGKKRAISNGPDWCEDVFYFVVELVTRLVSERHLSGKKPAQRSMWTDRATCECESSRQ